MKPSSAKAKGRKFEEQVAARIHSYFYEELPEYAALCDGLANANLHPSRDKSSGNYSTSDGDIDLGVLKKYFPFSIECKHRKDLNYSLDALMKGNVAFLEKTFEKQCAPKAEKFNLEPLIVFKGNRTDTFVMCRMLFTHYLTRIDNAVTMANYCITTLEGFLTAWNVYGSGIMREMEQLAAVNL